MRVVAFRQHRGAHPQDADAGAPHHARTQMPTQPTFTCATCDAPIAGHPTFHLGLAFCCAGCAADGPCMCSYDHLGHFDSPGAAVVVEAATVEAAVAETPVVERPVVERPAVERPAARETADKRVPVAARG